MSELSPGARAVSYAYDIAPEKETDNHRYHWLAAALRAIIEKCAYDDFGGHWVVSADDIDRIATELEAQ